jgi:hypothetical protein
MRFLINSKPVEADSIQEPLCLTCFVITLTCPAPRRGAIRELAAPARSCWTSSAFSPALHSQCSSRGARSPQSRG